MSPRRSSRARATQHTPSGPQHSNSSSSSITSGRASHSTGSDHRLSSQRNSAAARSQFMEEPAKFQASRTRRGPDDAGKEVTHVLEDDMDEEGEDEVTRCICGNQEYPGLPVSVGESSKGSPKVDSNAVAFSEDATGWFIQCDGCKVWQHGGCVGIMDEATSPEEYFCEQCRKDLHRVTATPNGRKYTLYLPAQESKILHSSPIAAPRKHSKRSKNDKAGQLKAESISKGRRSTMNSRDAGFGEEQIRLAIEESKREGRSASTILNSGKGKRSRSESEEPKEGSKRQRTTSGSTSSASQSKNHPPNSNSEDETEKPEQPKNIRGAAMRNHKNKEARERDLQREKERVEAGRRKGRPGRDVDSRSATPEPQRRNISTRGNKPATTSFPAPVLPDHQVVKPSHKKTGRPPARKGRVGRNQYTRDREMPTQNDMKHKSSPAPSNSSQTAEGGTPLANGATTGNGDTNGVGKPSRPRHMNPNRTTMNDMKRRVAGILEYISHTQVDMAGAATAWTTKSSTSTNTLSNSNNSNGSEHVGGLKNINDNGKSREAQGQTVSAAFLHPDAIDEQAFAALNSVEMMDVLTKRLMKWQGEYGKWGDK